MNASGETDPQITQIYGDWPDGVPGGGTGLV